MADHVTLGNDRGLIGHLLTATVFRKQLRISRLCKNSIAFLRYRFRVNACISGFCSTRSSPAQFLVKA